MQSLKNQLLSAPEDYALLAPDLQPVVLSLSEKLYWANEPARYVYFPETAVISMLSMMEDGSSTEVGLVGREGMLGVRVLLGARETPHAAVVQVAGTALRMEASALDRVLHLGSPLQTLLLRYTQSLLTQIRQSAACNIQHSIYERFARWLLSMRDYARSDELHLTHELISLMMGTRRAGVSVAAAKLQEAGLIHYQRGSITIVDREGLEAAACECYRIVKRETNYLYAKPATGD
jgi:CRP-like cAMP-binding protein